jgi:hypothetical protein
MIVRSSTANPYGFRPWNSRLQGLGATRFRRGDRFSRLGYLGVVGPVVSPAQPNVPGGDNAVQCRPLDAIQVPGGGVTWPSGCTPPTAAVSPSGQTITTQLTTAGTSIYQDLQTPITLPIFGNVPLLYVLGGALAVAAFFMGDGGGKGKL